MLTSGSLAALQEVIASWLAHDRSKHGHYFSSRVPKMAAYGAFISAPMGHFLIYLLQKVFAGRTSLRAKILQILTSNLLVGLLSPIQSHSTDIRIQDRADPKLHLPCKHGLHRWRPYLASSARHCPCWLLACDEGQLDHLAHRTCLCAAVSSRTNLGAVLQCYCICDWNVHQYSY
jgi:hypothetical protein